MLVPSLFELSVSAVAKGIEEETLHLYFQLDTTLSNAVFRDLLLLNSANTNKLSTLSCSLIISEIDFTGILMDSECIWTLNKFNLTSLSLGNLSQLSDCDLVDIAEVLRIALNEETQKKLIHLGLNGNNCFEEGWEREVSKMLPSLRSLDISSNRFSDYFQFPEFCQAFSNIRCLNISCTKPQNLEGIQYIKNLEKLVMCDVKVLYPERYRSLSELKNLRYLDVSSVKKAKEPQLRFDMYPVVGFFLRAGVRFENLEFLDCSRTLLSDEEFHSFVGLHAKLKMVVAIGIDFFLPPPPRIHLLHLGTIAAIFDSSKYSIAMNKSYATQECVIKVVRDLQNHLDDLVLLKRSELQIYYKIMRKIKSTLNCGRLRM